MTDKVSFVEFVELYMACVISNDKTFQQNSRGLYTPAKHFEVCHWLEAHQTGTRLLMAHRGFGKTTVSNLYIAWRLYLDPQYTVLIISATSGNATKNARAIKGIIEHHPLCKGLEPSGKHAHWQATSFTVNRPVPTRMPSVTVTSVGSSFTGARPIEVYCDDMEDPLNANTPENRTKVRNALMEAKNLSSDILLIGTPHDEDTIYNLVEKQTQNVLKIPVYGFRENGTPYDSVEEGGEVQVPEFRTVEYFEDKRNDATTAVWDSQYRLIPAAAYDVVLDKEFLQVFNGQMEYDEIQSVFARDHKPHWLIDGGEVHDIKAFWDPATGLKNRDCSVVCVACSTDQGNIYVLDLVALPPIDPQVGYEVQFLKLLEVLARNNCPVVYVEDNIDKTLHIRLKKFAQEKRKQIRVIPKTRTVNKQTFIAEHLDQALRFRLLHVRPEHLKSKLIEELNGFPNGRHDDHIDALAACIHELRTPGYRPGNEPRLGDRQFKMTPRPVVVNAPA